MTSARDLYERTVAELAPAAAENRLVDLVEAGTAPVEALRRIAGEEYRIIHSDRRSFALLAARFADSTPASAGFFLGLAQGEGQALDLLPPFAAAVGLSPADLAAHRPRAAAQTYPHYLAWLAQSGALADTVLALLANFGFWGGYCARLADALPRHYGLSAEATAFFRWFATLPPDFEPTALALLQSALDTGDSPDAARHAAHLMQAYEASFWAAVL
ncbi:transcriptional regulator [Kitasatospora sp. NPDC059795]|uniref:transcriptional regulator n=1 Tax=Kitasatospora sp. NPDC059795 TaxID=3346949 RepID=UPI0036511F64